MPGLSSALPSASGPRRASYPVGGDRLSRHRVGSGPARTQLEPASWSRSQLPPRRAIEIEVDLELLLGEGKSFLFPQREARPYESSEPHLEIGALRVEAVEALLEGRTRLLVTTLRALQERAPIPAELAGLRLTLRVGEEVGFRTLIGDLAERGFERVPIVEEVGQFAVRGGLLDVFSFGTPEPVRVEFSGDEITSLRFFDILDQRTRGTTTEAHILPVDFQRDREATTLVSRSLLELLPADALLLSVHQEGGVAGRTRPDVDLRLPTPRRAYRRGSVSRSSRHALPPSHRGGGKAGRVGPRRFRGCPRARNLAFLQRSSRDRARHVTAERLTPCCFGYGGSHSRALRQPRAVRPARGDSRRHQEDSTRGARGRRLTRRRIRAGVRRPAPPSAHRP